MFDSLYPTMQWANYRSTWPHAQHSQFIQAGGIQWHVQIMGLGPVLLLLHGTGSGSFSWRGLMPLLSAHFQVIAPDLPGHAFTSRGPEGSLSLQGMSEGLRALLLQLNVTPSIIGGHSAGAAIAANMLLQQRALSQTQLIGFNPAWLPLPGLPSLIFRPAAKLAAINPVSAWATAKLASKPAMIEKSILQTGSQLDAQGLALYQSVFSHSGHVHSVLNMMAAWQLDTLSKSLPQLQNKVSILVGMQDQTVPPSMAHEACKLMPQARVFEQHGLGHLAHEEDPAGTAQLILTHCEST
ncbi:alpha/beta fold hydrolase BchO [Limnohabitans sp. Hippo4]|uniref:alpha/beta fold hydrolase BchO n=1 Tax=Limnohabitans sp. Hippo4 TaxID=1826167 RepID=UPI000D36E3B2|nr:alpha/beta fold hydrolase BchO [Limnohabitans sp. Hippo4]PUE37967.1 alpha/beta hydrolase [Limnohabitans sp. Hippo4]